MTFSDTDRTSNLLQLQRFRAFQPKRRTRWPWLLVVGLGLLLGVVSVGCERPELEPVTVDHDARDEPDDVIGQIKCASLTAALARAGTRAYDGYHWEPRRAAGAADGWQCVLVADDQGKAPDAAP